MSSNRNRKKTQNSRNIQPIYYNPDYPNQSPNPQHPQHPQHPQTVPNDFFSANTPQNPNIQPIYYNPYYGMPHPQNPPIYNPHMSAPNENIVNLEAHGEYEGYSTQNPSIYNSTQMSLGSMDIATEAEPSSPPRKKNVKWTTAENKVLISGYFKFGTDSIVGNSQRGEAFWDKITEYVNLHYPENERDQTACKNRHNYINLRVGKWIGAYDSAKRMKQSGWSEADILSKAHELYKSCGMGKFGFLEEWVLVRDQPRYASQVGGNTGSDSSGSKRSREEDGGDSSSVGSIPRPIGRDAAKKRGKKKVGLSPVKESLATDYRGFKAKDWERLDLIANQQQEANKIQLDLATQQQKANKIQLDIARTEKMKFWYQLGANNNRTAHEQKMYDMLTYELFED